jgi:hypothetical protein
MSRALIASAYKWENLAADTGYFGKKFFSMPARNKNEAAGE